MIVFRKPEQVQAFYIPDDARAGDYLVIGADGSEVIPRQQFDSMFVRSNPVPVPPANTTSPIPVERNPIVFDMELPDAPPPRRHPPQKPSEEEIRRLKAQEAQTSVICCATCGEDVAFAKADANQDCPKCSVLPPGTPKKILVRCPGCGQDKQPHKIVAGKCVDCLGGD